MANAVAKQADETLPNWDLTDLYPGMESPELAAELDGAEADAKEFAKTYQGKIAGLSGERLGEAIAERHQPTVGWELQLAHGFQGVHGQM